MSSIRNRVSLIGHTGKDPEVKDVNDSQLARVTLATNENYRDAQGEKKTDTQWHQLVAWGKTASIFENYVKKGKEIAVEGKLISRSYDTKEGEKRYITEVKVDEVQLLGGRPE